MFDVDVDMWVGEGVGEVGREGGRWVAGRQGGMEVGGGGREGGRGREVGEWQGVWQVG